MAQGLPPPALVRPASRQEGASRPALALVGGAILTVAIVALVASSSSGAKPTSLAFGQIEYVPLSGMPDPAEAVSSAARTVQQVDPMHTHGNAFAFAAQSSGEDDVPKLITSPRYAATLGQEAAKHALSQPFNVPLERGGVSVPGDVAPDGQYAPVEPAYSNPLARFIPNVTYYEVGESPGARKGGHNIKFYNPFIAEGEDDGSRGGGAAEEDAVEGAAPADAVDAPAGGQEDGGDVDTEAEQQAMVQSQYQTQGGSRQASYLSALSRLYAALAQKEQIVDESERKQAAIRAAIQRLQSESRGGASMDASNNMYSTSGLATERLPRQPSGGMITVSPTGPQ